VDTFGASEALPAILNWEGDVPMGQPARRSLNSGECMGVATGGMLPPGADDIRLDENFLKNVLMRKCLSEDVRRCQQMSVIVREFLSESATSQRFAHCHGGCV